LTDLDRRLEPIWLPLDEPLERGRFDLEPFFGFHADAPGAPLVMLRSWSTEAGYQQALARSVGPVRPILSVGPPVHPDREGYPVTMADWVDHYVALLDLIGLGRIGVLGGWSFGGAIAVEVARVLGGRGVDVPRLLLIDSRLPAGEPTRRPRSLNGWYRKLMIRPRAWRRALAARVRGAGATSEMDVPPPENLPPGQALIRAKSGYTISCLSHAVQSTFVRYRPRPFDRPVHLFSTQFSLRYYPGDVELGWGQWLTGEFEVRPISGGHWSMYEEPHLAELAAAARDVLMLD
jgi:thioesterase domain-containing protein